MTSEVIAAAAHAAPVWMDTEAIVGKAIALMTEAAGRGAPFIVFPESFIPDFPIWSAIAAPIVTHHLFKMFARGAIRADGPEMDGLRAAARRLGVVAFIDFAEGTEASVGCLWNSTVLIGLEGSVLNRHRKIMPTYYEKLVWAPGDGAGLRIVETPAGHIGGLICGENTNPLARSSSMAQGEQIHPPCCPPIWPTRMPGDGVGYDIEEAIRIRRGAHAFEIKCFSVVASGVLDEAAINALSGISPEAEQVLHKTPRAVSMVLGPDGRQIGETQRDEGVLYATFDLTDCNEQKQFNDVTGYYNRLDIFRLEIDRTPRQPARFRDELSERTLQPRQPPADTVSNDKLNALN
jgi:nitrilase